MMTELCNVAWDDDTYELRLPAANASATHFEDSHPVLATEDDEEWMNAPRASLQDASQRVIAHGVSGAAFGAGRINTHGHLRYLPFGLGSPAASTTTAGAGTSDVGGGTLSSSPSASGARRAVLRVSARWWAAMPRAFTEPARRLIAARGHALALAYPPSAVGCSPSAVGSTAANEHFCSGGYSGGAAIVDDLMRLYTGLFAFARYAPWLPKPPRLCEVTSGERRALARLARERLAASAGGAGAAADDALFAPLRASGLVARLDEHIVVLGGAVFCKTEFKSAKNDAGVGGLQPKHDALGVLDELSGSAEVYWASLHEDSDGDDGDDDGNVRIPDVLRGTDARGRPRLAAIALTAWEPRLQPDNEYRAFVHGGKLVAASQQRWGDVVGLTPARAACAARAIGRWYSARAAALEAAFGPAMVLDVWVDEAQARCGGGDWVTEEAVRLIEINPGGAWACSGSALFDWTRDYAELHGDGSVVHVRFRVKDSVETN